MLGLPTNPLVSFQPSPALARFVTDDSPKICARAANGAGKTMHVVYKMAWQAVHNPGYRYRLAGPSRNQVRDVSGRYLYHFLRPYLDPRSHWNPGTGWNRNNTAILANGAEIELRSYKDPLDVFEGAHDLEMAVLDEPPDLAVLDANRRARQLILSFTAVSRNAALVPKYKREIEGNDDSPTEGRTEHETGWVQYVVPMLRANVPWKSEEEYNEAVAKYRGTPQEPQRLWAAWTGVVEERKFGGWSSKLILDSEGIRRRLSDHEGKIHWDVVRYGIDHGTGVGKQCQYLIIVAGDRYFVVDEFVGGGNNLPKDSAKGLLQSAKNWLHDDQLMALSRIDRVYGDINSAGPAGGGATLNQLIHRSLCLQTRLPQMPFGKIRTPTKTQGWREAREVAMNHAMLEGRWFVHKGCERAIRAYEAYRGESVHDPHKDPIDAQGYAVQDLLLTQDDGGRLGIRR